MLLNNVITKLNNEKDEMVYKIIRKLIIEYSCKTMTILGRFPINNFSQTIVNSRIKDIKNSNIWDLTISNMNTWYFKQGVTYLKLDKYTYIIFNYDVMIDKALSDYTPEVLKVYIIGKNKDRYYNSINRNIQSNKPIQIEYQRGLNINNPLTGKYSSIKQLSFDDIISINKNIIKDYINSWKNNEEIYEKYNIMYRTGILLYGPPGTGKSSVAKAICNELGVHTLQILDLTLSMNDLRRFNLYSNSVVLIDDIDCILKNRSDKDSMTSEEKEKLKFVLDLLDGNVGTCYGCVFIATTNHIDNLDSALIRDGRFNLKVEMDHFNKDEATQMCKKYDENPDIILRDELFPIKPALLENKIIQYKFKNIGLIK